MSSPLRTTPTPRGPSPRRVLLTPEHWVALVGRAAGLALPRPFSAADGPVLDPDAHATAERELRATALVTGDSDDLVRDLHPSLLATLLVTVAPQLQVSSAVRRGPTQVDALHLVSGGLAAGLRRTVTDDGAPGALLGPVELTTCLPQDVALEVVDGLGGLDGRQGRRAVRCDAVTSVAVVAALKTGREELAAELTREGVPSPLRSLAAGVAAVARVAVSGPRRTEVLVLLRTDDGWWSAGITGDDVVLRPVDRDGLVTDVAAAVSAALLDGSA